jgi:hypothetical protein
VGRGTSEFFELSFEDGFVHAVCGGQVRANEMESRAIPPPSSEDHITSLT